MKVYQNLVLAVDLQSVIDQYVEGLDIDSSKGKVITKDSYVDTSKGKVVIVVSVVREE
jgi:hypothetical protein